MDAYIELTVWVFRPQVWIIFGIALVIADIFLGYDFFVLPAGIAAFIISGLIYGQNNQIFGDVIFFETWHGVGITYAILSLISIGLIKFVLQRKKEDETDINEY